jgi:N utilization substance protein A
MEITDLVNTIEGLTEDQTMEIVARAETLAEEQAEEMPRRKGARAGASTPVETTDEESRAARPTLDDLFAGGESEAPVDESAESSPPPQYADADESDLTAVLESDEIRDLALAAERLGVGEAGHEVTSPPSDADQSETVRIVTEAVEAGASPRPIEVSEAGAGRNVPPLPPTEPFSTDEVEGRDSEMYQS